MSHKPSWTFREEDQRDRLDGRRNEEEGEWDPVGALIQHIVRSKINGCTNDGSNAELGLVNGENNAAQVSWGCFADVDLAKCQEPAHRYA